MNNKTRDLVYMALYAALFIALDQITLFRMPQGGSINLSSIALLLASYHFGWKKGALVAYTAYGFASLFPNVSHFYTGIVITSLIRLACSTFSGCVAWETPFWASLAYNAEYILPVAAIDVILVPIIFEKLKPVLRKD